MVSVAVAHPAPKKRDQKLKGYVRAILALSILFVISGTFSRLTILNYIDKAIMGFECIILMLALDKSHIRGNTYILLIVTAFLHVIALLFPISPREGIATYFMFGFWVLFWTLLIYSEDVFFEAANEMRRFIKTFIYFWDMLILVAMFIPSCYKVGWGGASYFAAFSNGTFEIVPLAMFVLSLDILLLRIGGDARQALVLSLVPLACAFAGGTRTYLVVMILEVVILLRFAIKRTWMFTLCLSVTLVAFIYISSVTNIGQKFISASYQTDDTQVFLTVLTNGRNRIWDIDIDAFLKSGLFTKLFGHGFSYVYDINQSALGMRIYAHNDFINIALNFGIVGVVVYLAVIIPILRRVRRVADDAVIYIAYMGMWLFNAMFNMVYVYAVAVVAMGVLYVAIGARTRDGLRPSPSTSERG